MIDHLILVILVSIVPLLLLSTILINRITQNIEITNIDKIDSHPHIDNNNRVATNNNQYVCHIM